VYVAFNGTSYPGSGPNIVKEFRNETFANHVQNGPSLLKPMAFPNPASDQIRFQWSMNTAESNYQVHNFHGQLVKEGLAIGNELVLDCENWDAGAYFIILTNNQQSVTATFQIQH
jgi:hypothetical protein